MATTTDFNISPYFDDYNELKNFHKILFMPLIPIQAREMNQLQTILQNQIERFGNQIFKDGSVVYGCSPQVNPNFKFVRVQDLFNVNINRDINDIDSSCLLVGQTSNVRAVPLITKEGRISQYPDTNRFYLKYLNTGIGGATEFLSNEIINVYNSDQNALSPLSANNLIDTINVLQANATIACIGAGYAMTINEGEVFQKGFFQRVDKQIGLVRDFDQNTYNMVVGFDTQEVIVTQETDETLYDNALGYPNYNAPGAHRLKLIPTLIAKDKTQLANNDSFFVVYEFSNVNGELVQVQNQPAYDALGDVMASQMYEDDGDFVIKPFMVETVPHETDITKFYYQIDPGIAYVHGRRVEYLGSKKILADRGIDTKESIQQLITTNYGNYVFINELAGVFSNGMSIDLYDTAQLAITNRRWQSTPLGTKIGTATVRTILYANGQKGAPSGQYFLYLYNIKMNSGKSFSGNVKSFYSNTSGIAVADSILINNQTLLQESSNNKLLFPLSKQAVKTLRSSNGTINRTEFVTRMSANATLQENGFIQVTLSAPPAGGINSLDYSTGTLGDILENDFNVILTSNVVSAALAGTINANTTSTNVTGSGTSFNTIFSNNEFIAITSGSTTDYRRILSVNSATSLTLAKAPTISSASATFTKFYPGGYVVPLNNTLVGTRTINITSNTTFEINSGLATGANLANTQTVVVQFKLLRSQAVQKKKNILRNLFVKVDANTLSSGSLNLGLTDVFNISGIWAGNTYATTNQDVSNYFSLNSGQTDDIYDHSKLVINPKYNGVLTNEKILVKLDRFVSNTSAGIGFYSVDSYPIDDANSANTLAISTYEIPIYKTSTGTNIDLRNAIDFRQYKIDTAINTTDANTASINPVVTQTFVSGNPYIPEPDSNFQTDLTFYLPRKDLINMNSTGGLTVIEGNSSETPRTPISDQDSMTVATAYVTPYPSLTIRENETASRKDLTISTSAAMNRNYTKKDIGTLDQRVQRLEYYVTLNQLEQQAKDLQVSDANGLNRFKNGIFADPLNSHAFGDTENFEYKVAIDSGKGYARPLFKSENIDIILDSNNSTVQQTGNLLSLPYVDELVATQPFATKYRNCTEDFWSWNGMVDIYPQYDMNRDETILPNIDSSIDLTQPFMDFANSIEQSSGASIFGTRFGDWRTTANVVTNDSTNLAGVWAGGAVWTRTVTNEITQERTVTNTFSVPITNTIDLGKYVTDVSVQPYMRSREIAFVARNLKPNSTIYAFFDNEPVSNSCAPGILTTTSSNLTNASNDTVVSRSGNWGTPLVSDQYGNLIGKFLIPAGKFRIGDRTLLLVNVDNLTVGADAVQTKASAVFTASNISTSSRSSTLTTSTPSIQTTTSTETRSFEQSNVSIAGFVTFSGDPIAQTYSISAPNMQSGVFGRKLNLYFKSKDPNLGVTVLLTKTSSGFPDTNQIISQKHLDSSQINISNDGTIATTFEFVPTYHDSNTQYSFVVMPDSNSPNYTIWMAEVGTIDVISGSQVYACPYSGAALKSSNAKTWTTLPKEQIKFDFYVAKYTSLSSVATFVNDADDYITYSLLSLTNSNNSIQIGDELYPVTTANAISNTSIYGRIENLNTTNATIKIDGSTGNFAANNKIGVFRFKNVGNTSQANSTTLIGTFNISSIRNPKIHAVVPKIGNIVPLNTSLNFEFKATSNTGSIDSTFNQVQLENEREFRDYERVVYSKSNEVTANIKNTAVLKSYLTSTNEYISPIIDLTRKSIMTIENIINNDATNENTRYGNALCKYLCKPIVLADGQDAEDIQIYISSWRPVNTDFKVYCKILNGEDYDQFETKDWSLMTNNGSEIYSSSLNPSDFKEYMFTLPTSPVTTNSAYKNTTNNNVAQYVNSTGAIFIGYKIFAIKVVILSSESCIAPILDNVRCLNLQV